MMKNDLMRLAEEIQQKSFASEYQKLAINIMFTSSWLQGLNARRFRPFDISLQQYNILRILRGQHPHPAKVTLLQERMIDRMSNASRLVEKLRRKGLVERKTCENDRRACDVLITEQGLAILHEIGKTEKESNSKLKTLSVQEAKRLNALLDKLRS